MISSRADLLIAAGQSMKQQEAKGCPAMYHRLAALLFKSY